MTASVLFLLIFCTPARAVEAEVLTCCDGASASKSLVYYGRLRDILAEDKKGWQAQITGWFAYVRSPRGTDLSAEDRRVYRDLFDILSAVQTSRKREVLRERFPEITKHLHYLALRHPGGSKQVALIGCGQQVWLQDPEADIKNPYGDCEAEWVRASTPSGSP